MVSTRDFGSFGVGSIPAGAANFNLNSIFKMLEKLLTELAETWGYTPEELLDIKRKMLALRPLAALILIIAVTAVSQAQAASDELG